MAVERENDIRRRKSKIRVGDPLHLLIMQEEAAAKGAKPLSDVALRKMICDKIAIAVSKLDDEAKPLEDIFRDLLSSGDERIQIGALGVLSKFLPKEVNLGGQADNPLVLGFNNLSELNKDERAALSEILSRRVAESESGTD